MSPSWWFGVDAYTRRARLQPAFLVLLPLLLAYGAWFPEHARVQTLPFVGVIYLVMAGLLSQVARDRGSRLEADLFRRWNGPPTTRELRHRNRDINSAIRERYHARLNAVMPDVRLPTAAEEKSDPLLADQKYEACVARLREHTRLREQFPLVFEENANYGYRRNVWAMRPLGVSLAAIGLGIAVTRGVVSIASDGDATGISVVVSTVNALLLALWIFHFDDEWVRIAGNAYARQLLGACERLPDHRTST